MGVLNFTDQEQAHLELMGQIDAAKEKLSGKGVET